VVSKRRFETVIPTMAYAVGVSKSSLTVREWYVGFPEKWLVRHLG
jgi:hypothetical protein